MNETNPTVRISDFEIMCFLFQRRYEHQLSYGFVNRKFDYHNRIFWENDKEICEYGDDAKRRKFIFDFLNEFNKKHFLRIFKEDSRSSLCKISINNPNSFESELFYIIFDSHRQLNNKLLDDFIDGKVKCSRIYFDTNLPVNQKSKDKRIQLLFNKRSKLYDEINDLMIKYKIIDEKNEFIDDLNIIIGGTTLQDPHYDFARLFTSFYNDSNQFEVGYEINRYLFNENMSSEFGHRSVIFGFNKKFSLGVPQSHLMISKINKHMARIRMGRNEPFTIKKLCTFTSHNNNGLKIPMAILEIPSTGCSFVGDFPHSGANNIDNLSKNNQKDYTKLFNTILKTINKKITSIKDRENIYKALYYELKRCQYLPSITRLFYKTYPTRPIHMIDIPEENVSFYTENHCPYVRFDPKKIKINILPKTIDNHIIKLYEYIADDHTDFSDGLEECSSINNNRLDKLKQLPDIIQTLPFAAVNINNKNNDDDSDESSYSNILVTKRKKRKRK